MRCAHTIRIQAVLPGRQQRLHNRPHAGYHPCRGLCASQCVVQTHTLVHLPSEGQRCCGSRCFAQPGLTFFPRNRYLSASLSSVSALSLYVRPSIFPRNSILRFEQVQLRGNTLPPDPMPKPPSVRKPLTATAPLVFCSRNPTSLV